MTKTFFRSNGKVLSARVEEIFAEYVWTNCIDESASGQYFRLTVDQGKSCVVRALFADKNFRICYSQGRRYKIKDDDQYLVLSAHYRRKLGGVKTYLSDRQCRTIEFQEVKFGWLRASRYFPTPYAWLSSWLGICSVMMGLISLMLSGVVFAYKCMCK